MVLMIINDVHDLSVNADILCVCFCCDEKKVTIIWG